MHSLDGLNNEDLKELKVKLGDRKKILGRGTSTGTQDTLDTGFGLAAPSHADKVAELKAELEKHDAQKKV